MLLFFVEALLGGFVLWHGRRWLVARLDENFTDSPEFFETDDPRLFSNLLACFAAFFSVIGVLMVGFPTFRAPGLALFICFVALCATWAVGNLSNWRRLEPGNPLRSPLDSVLSLDGRRPCKVRLRRSAANFPRFALDGALEIPNAFARSVPFDEQRFLYQIVRNRKGIKIRRVATLVLQIGTPLLLAAFAVVILHFPSWFTYFLLPLFHFLSKDWSIKIDLGNEDCQKALMMTGDFAAAERAIRRVLSVDDADKRVEVLREWWAVQNPANSTVMPSVSASAVQRAGYRQ